MIAILNAVAFLAAKWLRTPIEHRNPCHPETLRRAIAAADAALARETSQKSTGKRKG